MSLVRWPPSAGIHGGVFPDLPFKGLKLVSGHVDGREYLVSALLCRYQLDFLPTIFERFQRFDKMTFEFELHVQSGLGADGVCKWAFRGSALCVFL